MIDTILNTALLILILGFLVFIHELGHFLAAKFFGIGVDAFAVGMGPKVWGFRRGGTDYQINLLPIGGYVSIVGEIVEDEKDLTDPDSFQNKSFLARFSVLIAGVTFNLIFAVVIFYGFLLYTGFKFSYPEAISDFEPAFGSVKEEIIGPVHYKGLSEDGYAENNDWPEEAYVKGYHLDDAELVEFNSHLEVADVFTSNTGETLHLEICDDAELDACESYRFIVPDSGKAGFFLFSNVSRFVEYEGAERLSAGFLHAYNIVDMSIEQMGNIFSDASDSGDYTQVANSLAGPVGLYVIIDFVKEIGFLGILDLTANLSLTLFVMNLLPIPALDGGRIILLVAEKLLGDMYSKRVEESLIKVSFVLLLLLMFVIVVKDVVYFDQLREALG